MEAGVFQCSKVLNLSLLPLVFSLILIVASRLLYPYSTDDETSLLMVKKLSTVKEPKRFTELHGEEKRKEGDRGDQEEKKGNQKGRDHSSW